MLTREQFLKHLRGALNHLYDDPGYLRRSPLAALLGVADRFDAPAALRRILIEAIESLEPAGDELPQSPAWQIYGALYYRYVQQLSRQQVADQLGISTRQLSRWQRAALETLADVLWEQFDLEANPPNEPRSALKREPTTAPTVDEELAWLKETPVEVPVELRQTVLSVLGRIQPLAAQYKVRLEIALPEDLPYLAVHQLALKQTLLNLLSVAIHQAQDGTVIILGRRLHQEVEVEIQCRKAPPGTVPVVNNDQASLEMAHYLMDMYKGKLTLLNDEERFDARLVVPALEQLPVLVIDDNADTLSLLLRYASNTRYHLIGTEDPNQVLTLVERFSPKIIVLDVMMPQVDGWELLALLKQHPLTHHIPIVVCTVLPQEELADSLGADGYVRKPVKRQAFLAALDQQAERLGSISH
ncbi:MAG: response regulator [Anaerolineae bacterium]|nr:response regulator [Anaerolineae bacterium]